MTATTLIIPARFNGPPDSGNGGYSAGLIAGALGGGPVEVTLKAPPPLDRELAVERDGDGVIVRDGETVVATARPTTLAVEAPEPIGIEEAAATAEAGPFVDPERHPFPSCFVCGPDRTEGDGLRIFAGPVDRDGLFAAAWTPPESLAGEDGCVAEEVIWSALDCPTSAPVGNDPDDPAGFKPIVLARLAVHIERAVIAGRPYLVLAWPLAIDGRKREAAAALYTAGGQLCALSRALWIEVRTERRTADR